MNVSLVSVDSKIPNLALMKLSAYHKANGDHVTLFNPLFDRPDRIYASKVFSTTPDYLYFPTGIEIIYGGTGYNLTTTLSTDIETMYPDYELFGCDYAMGFTTRGCINNCSFCVVPQKEGKIRAVGDIYDFWRGQERLMLLDNNLTALPDHFKLVVGQIIKERVKVSFSQGLDIRLLNEEMANLLSKVRLWKQIHFAWDDVRSENSIRQGIDILKRSGIALYNVTFYVLIGFNSTPIEDLYRVEVLKSLGVNPFVMPYDRSVLYQRRFARWCNHKAIFKTVPWHKYKG